MSANCHGYVWQRGKRFFLRNYIFNFCDCFWKMWSDRWALPIERCALRKSGQTNEGICYRNICAENFNVLLDQPLNKINNCDFDSLIYWIFKILVSSTFFIPYLAGILYYTKYVHFLLKLYSSWRCSNALWFVVLQLRYEIIALQECRFAFSLILAFVCGWAFWSLMLSALFTWYTELYCPKLGVERDF